MFKIVHCGSTQQCYLTIELECLAIVWATLKCSFYLCGLPLFTIYTDHWPLQDVFREKIAMYSFQVCWVPGKTHLIADTLSRAPLFAPEDLPGLEIDTTISCLSQTLQPAIRLIYDAIDDDYRQLVEDINLELPSPRTLNSSTAALISCLFRTTLCCLTLAGLCCPFQL